MRRLIPLALAVAFVVLPSAPAQAQSAPCKPGSGPDLRGRNFSEGTELPRDLRCANLSRARLNAADLTQHDLTGANLRGASMKQADLTQATLKYADLREADLTEADLGQAHFDHADLRNAILVDVDATQSEFPKADLTGAKLTRGVFGQGNFTLAKLINADLSDVKFGQGDARRADFTGAKLHEADLSTAQFPDAVFRDADLREANFTMAELEGADLKGADVQDADFMMADDADLTGSKGTPKGDPTKQLLEQLRQPAAADEPEPDPAVAEEAPGKLPVGLILVLVSAVGLAATLLAWALGHSRRSRRRARYALAHRAAEEDVTRLGEAIDALDFDAKVAGVSATTTGDSDWRLALDAYEAAKRALSASTTREQLSYVAQAVQDGRNALERVRSRWASWAASGGGRPR